MSTYGFIAKNGNGDLIIDGSSSAYKSMQVKQTGVSGGDTTISHGSDEIVFATRSGTGSLRGVAGASSTQILGATAWFTAGPPSSYTGNENYGLKVFNQGNALAYDSRVSSSGFQIDNIFPAGTISGYRTGSNVSGPPSFETGDIIFSGSNPSGTYVSMQGALYSQYSGLEVAFGCYRFEQTNSRILFANFFDVTTYSGGPSSFTSVIIATYVS
jgi:hypothetical protein